MVRVERYKVMFLRRGKQAAEAVILQLARLLGEQCRREDVVARTDLDTLAVLLPAANGIGARRIAQQILNMTGTADFFGADEAHPVTISIGVVSPVITPESTSADLLAAAREKVQQAADAGGGCLRDDLGEPVLPRANVAEPEPQTRPDTAPLTETTPLPETAPSPETAVSPEAAASPEAVSLQEPVPAPLPEPAVATDDELRQALQALASGGTPVSDSDALLRAVLPVLKAWNQAHGECCSALIGELEARLFPQPDRRAHADAF
jgi:diguanylate cyclase (GGDEF)-like protein